MILAIVVVGAVIGAVIGASRNTHGPSTSSAAAAGQPPATAASCDVTFQARVQRGPDTGVTVRGQLHIDVDATGRLTGQLTTDSGVVAVSGEATGRSISMALTPSPDRVFFAVGVSPADVLTCQPPMGGPLTGPRSGDGGDWSIGNTPSGGTDPSGV